MSSKNLYFQWTVINEECKKWHDNVSKDRFYVLGELRSCKEPGLNLICRIDGWTWLQNFYQLFTSWVACWNKPCNNKNGVQNWVILSSLYLLVPNSFPESVKRVGLFIVRKKLGSTHYMSFKRYPAPTPKVIFMIILLQCSSSCGSLEVKLPQRTLIPIFDDLTVNEPVVAEWFRRRTSR